MNPTPAEDTKNTVDNAEKSKNAAQGLSEEQKKQLEMQATQEHEKSSGSTENLAEQATNLDEKK